MIRRTLDETRVGEYKSNWFLNTISLFISLIGIIAIFVLPMAFNSESAIEMSNSLAIKKEGSFTIFEFVNESKTNSIQFLICLTILIYFAIIFINSFVTIAFPLANKSVYVKISKAIDAIISFLVLGLLSYYLLVPVNNLIIFDTKHQFYLISFFSIFIIVNLILINSIISYFKSKKVSIYD